MHTKQARCPFCNPQSRGAAGLQKYWPSAFKERSRVSLSRLARWQVAVLLVSGSAFPLAAQQAAPIGRTSAKEVQVSGAVQVHDGQMLLGNGSAITAGEQPVNITLTRGGSLRLCATTAVHLSHDKSIDAQDSTALMMALDRGAIEANYETGKYSDVLLTPDLRILISGPGHADLKIRVNAKGDTCIDNHGANAPYVTVTSQMDGGLYRIKPDQHVTLEHGGLQDVIDTETEPCGCPAQAPAIADVGNSTHSAQAAANPFPLAQSEGLAPAPALPTTPVVPSGEVHAQVSVPLVFNGNDGNGNAPPVVPAASADAQTSTPAGNSGNRSPAAPPANAPQQTGIFHKLGHFFAKVFGKG